MTQQINRETYDVKSKMSEENHIKFLCSHLLRGFETRLKMYRSTYLVLTD